MAVKTLPNQYDLRGQGVTISYSVTKITGKPLLTFTKGRQTLNFSGDEIGVFDTTIGSLVTVTISASSRSASGIGMALLVTGISTLIPACSGGAD